MIGTSVHNSRFGFGLGIFALSVFALILALTTYSPAQAQSGAQLQTLESNTNHIVLELQVSSYDSQTLKLGAAAYTQLSIQGLGHINQAGKPQLPIKGALVGIPPGAEASLKILVDESTSNSLTNPPVPAPTTQVRSDPNETLPRFNGNAFTPDGAIYSGNQFYPAAVAQIGSSGNWRDQHYVTVEFHPLQYNPSTHQLRLHTRLRVEVVLSYPRGLTAQALGAPLAEGPFETILQKALVNYDSARNWRAKLVTAEPSKAQNSILASSGPWYKIGVDSDGIYQVTCGQIATAAGSALSIAASTLQVFKQGTELAIRVVGTTWGSCNSGDTSDYIEFFGQAPQAKYTNTNVYWLTFGNAAGKRMAARDGSGSGTVSTTFTNTLHLEQNLFYRGQIPPVEGADRWYWNYVYTAVGVPSHDYTFQLDHLATGEYSATLQIDLVGFSSLGHHTQVSVNGHLIDDTTWSGQLERRATIAFPQADLNTGSNTIHVSEPNDVDGGDFIFTNFFDVSYQSSYPTSDDVRRFRQETNAAWEYQIDGFSAPEVETFDITDPFNPAQIVNTSVTPGPCPCTLQFADSIISPHEYLTLTSAQRRVPTTVLLDVPSNLHASSNGADYIIIAYGGFLPNIQPLANYRASQGLRVQVIDAQNVYDEFSDGLVDAQAIHDFLAYAYTNWQAPAPSYVLLVGAGNFDPKGYCTTPGQCSQVNTPPNSTLIPPYLRFVDPFLGETASDNRLVAFNGGNSLPDMATGRLPAETSNDVNVMVTKILNYEQNPPAGDWRTKITFVTDNAYNSGGGLDKAGNFWTISDRVASNLDYVPEPFSRDRIYYNPCDPGTYPQCALPYPPYTTASSVENGIVGAINDGRLIVNYVGHAFIFLWADETFFANQDVNGLTNGSKTPVMLEMTCYTGYYIYPGLVNLAKADELLSGNGAVASWAATGLGVATGHDLIDQGFFDAVMQQGIYQLGPAGILGKTNLWLNSGGANLDLIDTFDWTGDPATRIAIPTTTIFNHHIFLPFILRKASP